MEFKVINQDGKASGKIELIESIFDQPYNEPLIHQVVVAQLANKRQGTKCALTRAEVRGGGIKPWRQKGTGRARQGSTRSPQWTHGGVAFAPKPRDFSQKINKKMRINALCSALSQKLREGDFIIVSDLKLETPKTKDMAQIISNIGVDKSAFVLTQGKDDNVMLASRNIPNIKVEDIALINVYDLVRLNKVVMTKEAVKVLMEVYA